MLRRICVGLLLVSLSGCAAKPLYDWGDYPKTLLKRSKGNLTSQEYAERLAATIKTLESTRKKVPPGLFAEYGFALLETGNVQGAVTQFGKEGSAYPESASFMKRVTERLASQPAASSPESAQPVQPAQPAPPATEAPATTPSI